MLYDSVTIYGLKISKKEQESVQKVDTAAKMKCEGML